MTCKTSGKIMANKLNRTLFIRDNLEVLRCIDDCSVDLIYLDPPFNSNKNYGAPIGSKEAGFHFKDMWYFSDTDEAWWGMLSEEHPNLYEIIHAVGCVNGKAHKAYLIYMAIRLIQMHRILKETGSIYLHCDPTMSHCLKLVMDAIFGLKNLRNEIIWQSTTSARNDVTTRFGRGHDVLLFYAKSKAKFNVQYVPLKESSLATYKYKDEQGRSFQPDNLTAPGGRGYHYNFLGVTRMWRMPEEQAHKLLAEGRIIHKSITKGSNRKVARYKRYLDESKGSRANDNWQDIPTLDKNKKESVGYATQKPLALLERIIKASSSEGDVVLDPFCGCATACIAAEKLGRNWIGIDISERAESLIKERLRDELNLSSRAVRIRKKLPIKDVPKLSKNIKHDLYGQQEGNCNGCKVHFPFKNLTKDHIIPQARGGQDTDRNLQLLCSHCNSTKGDRSMEYLWAKLEMPKLRSA